MQNIPVVYSHCSLRKSVDGNVQSYLGFAMVLKGCQKDDLNVEKCFCSLVLLCLPKVVVFGNVGF